MLSYVNPNCLDYFDLAPTRMVIRFSAYFFAAAQNIALLKSRL
jgi:hypothetical protein